MNPTNTNLKTLTVKGNTKLLFKASKKKDIQKGTWLKWMLLTYNDERKRKKKLTSEAKTTLFFFLSLEYLVDELRLRVRYPEKVNKDVF